MKKHSTILFIMLLLIGGAASLAQSNTPIWENPPVEHVPPLTDHLIESLKSRPIPSASLKILPSGAVALHINGEYTPFIFGATPLSDSMDSWHVNTWAQTGHNLVHVFANLAFYDPRRAYGDYHTPFWTDKNQYNDPMIETLLWRILRVHPDAQILLTLQVDVYPDWYIENPAELMRNEQGDGFVVGHHFRRTGTDPDRSKQEVLAPSFFSQKLIADQSETIRRFIQKLENTLPGRAVIGYVIGGNQDLQNYMWHPPNAVRAADANAWGDYSKPARRAWQNWAREKYTTIARLNAAWRSDYTNFDQLTPPPAKDLVGGPRYHNPATEQRSIDWKFFLARGRSSYILALARAARNASSREIIVGTYSGESSCRSDVVDNYHLLRSPELDFLFHQPFYGDRLPPAPSGISAVLGSHQLNHRLFICDMDHHTWLGRPLGKLVAGKGVSQNDRMVGRAQDITQLRAMYRREIGRLLANGLGWHYHPLHGAHQYEHDSIRTEMATLRKWTENTPIPSPQNPAAEVAVIFDEHAVPYLRSGLGRLHWQWWHAQIEKLNASGVPYRTYYADDLRASRVPPARLYVFLNQLDLDPAISAEINKLKAAGRVLVFKQDAGLLQYTQGRLAHVSKTIGIDLQTAKTTAPAHSAALDKDHPIAQSLGKINPAAQGLRLAESGLCVHDPKAAVLACYTDTSVPALAARDHGTWKSVFAGTDVLTAELFHALAKYANAWTVTDPGCGVAATDDLLMIHPLESKETAIRLKTPASLVACPPMEITTPKSLTHTLKLEAGNTYLFRQQR